MINKINIKSYNDKGQHHEYWEMYWGDKLWFRCLYNNDRLIGYSEQYNIVSNRLADKFYYIR